MSWFTTYCFHASETLLEFGRDEQRPGGELGVTTVLHTWSRTLEYHPHFHCIVTGGALSPDGDRWIAARPNYLFPDETHGIVFRGKLLDGLKRADRTGKLHIDDSKRFASTIAALYRKECLLQAAIRWSRAGHQVPWPVHPPRGCLEPSTGFDG